jgi:GNAT superfamily N-acetyltransferase
MSLIKKGYNTPYKEGAPESDPHFAETYTEDVESGKIRLFAAKDGGRVIGSVQYDDRDGKAFLGQMTVLPEFRNKGVGALLVSAAEDAARKEGFGVMELTAMVEKGLPKYYEKKRVQKSSDKRAPKIYFGCNGKRIIKTAFGRFLL